MRDDIKKEFIKEYCRSRIVSETSLNGVLNRVQAIERNVGKEITEFSQEEILNKQTSDEIQLEENIKTKYNITEDSLKETEDTVPVSDLQRKAL